MVIKKFFRQKLKIAFIDTQASSGTRGFLFEESQRCRQNWRSTSRPSLVLSLLREAEDLVGVRVGGPCASTAETQVWSLVGELDITCQVDAAQEKERVAERSLSKTVVLQVWHSDRKQQHHLGMCENTNSQALPQTSLSQALGAGPATICLTHKPSGVSFALNWKLHLYRTENGHLVVLCSDLVQWKDLIFCFLPTRWYLAICQLLKIYFYHWQSGSQNHSACRALSDKW